MKAVTTQRSDIKILFPLHPVKEFPPNSIFAEQLIIVDTEWYI